MQFCRADGYANGCGADFTGGGLLPKILVKGGTVVNAHHMDIADVYIQDGLILAIKPNIIVSTNPATVTSYLNNSFFSVICMLLTPLSHCQVDDDVVVIDARGKFVMPGSSRSCLLFSFFTQISFQIDFMS